MTKRTILIADPNLEEVRSLKRVLEGYEVIVVKDGSKALEQAVLKYPDLILFDRHCPLIGATQFLRILRSNPRTEEIPIIILSDAPLATANVPGFLQGILVKPLNLDEVRAHVAAVMRKVDAVKQVGAEDGAVSGSLEQISIPDLLQIFTVNRRSGSVQLTSQGREPAEVFIHDGRIEDAVTAGVRGDKALYRVLTWASGRFSFVPGRRAASITLSGSTDSLLMEGLRQTDELERLRPEMPTPHATLEWMVAPETLPEGLHPVTAEIASLIDLYPRMGDLLDKAKATDLEVHLALRSLFTGGYLRGVEPGQVMSTTALLNQDEVVELKSRLKRAGLAPTYLPNPKIAVLIDESELKSLAHSLSRLPGFRSGNLEQLLRIGMGPLGTLELEQGLVVDFYTMAADQRLLPLAFALSAGTVAGVLVGTSRWLELGRTLQLLEEQRRATLLVVRRRGDRDAPPGARRIDLEINTLDDETTRHIVRTLLTQVAGRDDLRGGSL